MNVPVGAFRTGVAFVMDELVARAFQIAWPPGAARYTTRRETWLIWLVAS